MDMAKTIIRISFLTLALGLVVGTFYFLGFWLSLGALAIISQITILIQQFQIKKVMKELLKNK